MKVMRLGSNEIVDVPGDNLEQMSQPKVGVALRPERLRVSTTLVRDRNTGEIFVDVFKRHAKPYWLTTEPTTFTIGGTGSASAGTFNAPIPMPTDRQGPIEIDYAYFQSDGDFTVTLFDPQGRPVLMNREIHARTIAGGFNTLGLGGPAGRPFIWPEPWFMAVEEGRRNFMVGFRNLSANENKIRFVLHGRRFYHQNAPEDVVKRYEEYYKKRPVTMPYFWTTDEFIQVSGVGTITDFQLRVTDDADVLLYKMTSAHDLAYEFKLIEKANGRELMGDFIRVNNAFGDGEFPYVLFEPMYFEAGTKLILRIKSLSADTNTIWPTFTSSKIFRSVRPRPIGAR